MNKNMLLAFRVVPPFPFIDPRTASRTAADAARRWGSVNTSASALMRSIAGVTSASSSGVARTAWITVWTWCDADCAIASGVRPNTSCSHLRKRADASIAATSAIAD